MTHCKAKKLFPTKRRNVLLAGPRRAALEVACLAMVVMLPACGDSEKSTNPDTPTLTAEDKLPDPVSIVEKHRAVENSSTSRIKIVARIVEPASTRTVHFTMFTKRDSDGRLLLLAQFTAPPEERDRSGLVTVAPDGEIEAVRYVQSSDKFVMTTSPSGEDSLFGMTLQELAGGQPEKYDYKTEEITTFDSRRVFKLAGSLKADSESRFPRIIMLIDSENWTAPMVELYDSRSRLARRLTVEEVKPINGYWTRMRWTVDNQIRGKRIEFQTTEAVFDRPIPDSYFSRDHLKRVTSR